MYRTRDTLKQKILLEQDKRIFSTSDLAVLWNITNKNTLHTTIKRYVKRNILRRIRKGLYSTTPIQKLNPYEIGCAISGPFSYISTETVLQNNGVIMQNIPIITLIGQKNGDFTIGNNTYKCRYLNSKFLVNRVGILQKGHFSIATTERAAADMIHLVPNYYFDNDSAIDKNILKDLNSKLGYQ